LQSTEPDTVPSFLRKRPSSAFIQVRINRKTLVATIVSLLVHLLALYIFTQLPKQSSAVDAANKPLEVSLAEPTPPQIKAPPEPVKTAAPKLSPRPTQKSKPFVAPPPAQVYNPISIPQPAVPPKSATAVTPAPTPAPPSNPSQATDLASYMREQKAKRGETEDAAATLDQQSTASSTPPPSGVYGIFQLNTLGEYSATVTFRGWRNAFSYIHPETFAVQALPGGDIRLEVIRKEIEIIRRYYSGNFTFYSERLRTDVTLSARREDNAGLEDFMLQELITQIQESSRR
jgi:hypothetical protein